MSKMSINLNLNTVRIFTNKIQLFIILTSSHLSALLQIERISFSASTASVVVVILKLIVEYRKDGKLHKNSIENSLVSTLTATIIM